MNEMDAYDNYDFSKMNTQLTDMTETLATLLYIVYTLLGLTSLFSLAFLSKLFHRRYCKKKEVVTLSEEQVKLISSLDDKLETLNYKVAIAFEVEKSNKETKNDDDFDPLLPPTESI